MPRASSGFWRRAAARAGLHALLSSVVAPAAASTHLTCKAKNCYGEAGETVAIGPNREVVLKGVNVEECREACRKTVQCEAILFSEARGECYGKRNIRTSLCQSDADFTLEVLEGSPWGTCAMMGDPHILGFDSPKGPTLDEYDPGVYHLVKSDTLEVQGRFGYTARFPTATSMKAIAIHGAAISGHSLVVEFTGPGQWESGFQALWDNEPILTTYPSSFTSKDGTVSAKKVAMDPSKVHTDAGHTIGGGGTLPSYEFFVGPDIYVYMLLGPDSMNVILRMRRVDGQDGFCGNFDCDAANDSYQQLVERGVATAIPEPRSLFRRAPAPVTPAVVAGGPKPDIEDCPAELKDRARASCSAAGSDVEVKACIFDVCAAKSVDVAKLETVVGQVVKKEEEQAAGAPDGKFGLETQGLHPTAPSGAHPDCPCPDGHGHQAAPCGCQEAGSAAQPCQCGCPCGDAGSSETTSTSPLPATREGPLMTCDLNCFGGAAEVVKLPGSGPDGDAGVSDLSLEACRDFCLETAECEGIVFGKSTCYGKKSIFTSRCQPGEGDFTTQVLRSMPKAVCGLFGDPHITTFDNPNGATLDQLGSGEFYLVTSSDLQITGRFGFSARFPNEASSVGLAVSGSVINGHRLVVQYEGPDKGHGGFKAYWDDEPILKEFPSEFKSGDHFLHAEFANMDPDGEHKNARHSIGGEHGSGDLPSFRFRFLPDWKIYVLLGEETMNVVIEMHQQIGGVDGYCGNFNCDPDDDTKAALQKRGLAGAVPKAESLFARVPLPASVTARPDAEPLALSDCAADLRAEAEKACMAMPNAAQKKGCIYDACASGSVKVVGDDISASHVEERLAVDVGEVARKFVRGLLGFGSPTLTWQCFLGMGMVVVSGLVGCLFLGRATRGSRYERLPLLDGRWHLRVAAPTDPLDGDDDDDEEEGGGLGRVAGERAAIRGLGLGGGARDSGSDEDDALLW